MHPDLEALLHLQEKDDAVEAAERALEELAAARSVLDRALEAAARTLEQARASIVEAARHRDELEGRIETQRVMQERRRQRLEFVRGAKEASTLMAELELARSVMAREEADWIRSSDGVAEAERRASEAEVALAALEAEQEAQRAALGEREQERRAKLEALRQERRSAARAVSPRLLGRYEKIRGGRAAKTLYPLHGDACGNCFTSIPLHRKQQIELGNAIESCEACGVLLYSTDSTDSA